MALKIEGDGKFQGQVVRVLGEICPCVKISTNSGEVVLTGVSGCSCCESPVGCTLLRNLVDSCESTISIVPACGNGYNKGRISFCYDPCKTSCDCNAHRSPLAASLAHEMIHAWLDCIGDPRWADEVLVVRGENQIRTEMGVGPRCSYGCTEIPLGRPWLPSDWRANDTCSVAEVWRCSVKTALRNVVTVVRFFLIGLLFKGTKAGTCPSSCIGYDSELWDWSTPPTLDQRVQQALSVRSFEPVAAQLDRIIETLKGATPTLEFVFLMERIRIDYPYEATLIFERGGRTEVVSNQPTDTPGLAWFRFGPRTPARMKADQELLNEVTFPTGPPAQLGDPSMTDGTVTILTVMKSGEPTRRATLYGIGHLEDDPGMPPPTNEDQRVRWDAINAFANLRQGTLNDEPESVESLRA